MPTSQRTVAPDVANNDGTVSRVTTITTIFQPDEYQAMLAQQQQAVTIAAAQVAAMQPIAQQIQAMSSGSGSGNG